MDFSVGVPPGKLIDGGENRLPKGIGLSSKTSQKKNIYEKEVFRRMHSRGHKRTGATYHIN